MPARARARAVGYLHQFLYRTHYLANSSAWDTVNRHSSAHTHIIIISCFVFIDRVGVMTSTARATMNITSQIGRTYYLVYLKPLLDNVFNNDVF